MNEREKFDTWWFTNRNGLIIDGCYDDALKIWLACAAEKDKELAVLGVWIPITDSLPKSGKPVLIACRKKVLRAAHAAKFALDEETWGLWSDGDGADYNEANDTTYWPEGWYEWNEYEECHWMVENEPTHWMPVPESPT